MIPVKITVVGDGMVGKTCLLITYERNAFPEVYVPTVFDNYACNITVDDQDYNLVLWDTAGQETYERLRPLSYPNTNCFIICYSVDNRTSFDNIFNKWLPEIRHFCPTAPIVLVATKVDLRIEHAEKFVTEGEGKRLKTRIKASAFVECSARLKQGLNEVIEEAVRASALATKKPVIPSCTFF